ncbi:MAG TPA: hypothetical protein VFI31_05250 [Pirellulales bacterium]|nr:hypothetical protein [Pirellulales bacterium]
MVLLTATIALGGLSATRVRARAGRWRNDLQDARQYAISATDVGRLWIAQDKNWRTDYSNGAWFSNQPIGRGKFSLSVTNPNGALNHSLFDPVILSATGVCGKSTQYAQVTLTAKTIPYTCLTAALSASTNVALGSAVVDANNQMIATNGSISATSPAVNANVQAMGLIAGGTYNGTSTTITTALTFPDTTVFNYYQTNGTAISIGSIPSATIQNVLISPSSNPYGGGTNSNGVYVIDCQGNNLLIQNCRIIGSLLLLNPGAGTQIGNSVVWRAAVNNYPCLLVNGSLAIASNGTYLSEAGTYNFNPAGAPYPWPSGTSNSTMTDSYPPAFMGLVYVAGNVTLGGSEFVVNLLTVGGTFTATSSTMLYLNYDPTYYNGPPPGFGPIQMVPSPGTWQQVVH